jgi:hypothetical protein
MKNLLWMCEILETIVKGSNKLKTKKRLNSGKDHSGFFDHRSCFFFEARWSSCGVLIFGWHFASSFYSPRIRALELFDFLSIFSLQGFLAADQVVRLSVLNRPYEQTNCFIMGASLSSPELMPAALLMSIDADTECRCHCRTLIREAERASGYREQAFRRAGPAAFMWPEEQRSSRGKERRSPSLRVLAPLLHVACTPGLRHHPQASIRHRFVASFSRAQARRILVEKPEWHRLSNGDLQKHTV